MGKKKAAKKGKPREKKTEAEKDIGEEKTFDFGGLPSRDLKKNLGCG